MMRRLEFLGAHAARIGLAAAAALLALTMYIVITGTGDF